MSGNVDKPQLAVVVISFRAQAGLTASIQSILDQDTPAELVVVNSGGGDVTRWVPAGANIRIITTDETWWPGAARNRGIDATEAPFVAFLAADCLAEPGWVAARLRHHHRGAAVLGSAIVNANPESVVSTAYHIVNAANRDVNIPVRRASNFGASYARWIFLRYGMFREDLRVAEDSEFNRRLEARERPQWAADVRTVHRNPLHLLPALREHYARGKLYGRHWPEKYSEANFLTRIRRIVDLRVADLRELIPPPVPGRRVLAPLAIAAMVLASQLGKARGVRQSSKAIRTEIKAREAERNRDWPTALSLWARAAKQAKPSLWQLRARADVLAKTRHFKAALKAYDDLVGRAPGDGSLQVAKARMALAAGEIERARDVALAAMPAHGRALPLLELVALTDLAIGSIEAVSRTYAEIAKLYPYSAIGGWGLVELALAAQRWDEALALLDDLWTRYGEGAALERKARLLIYLGRLAEVDATLDALATDTSHPAAHLLATLHVLAARADIAGLGNLARRREPDILADSTLLSAFASALAISGNSEQARALVAASQAGAPDMRAMLDVLALLYAGRPAEAWAAYAPLANLPRGRELTTSTFSALVTAAYDAEGPAAALALVQRTSQPKSRGALRLAAMFQSARLAGLAALRQNPPQVIDGPPMEALLAEPLAQQMKGPAGARDLALIEEARRRFTELRATHADFAPDPSFILADALKVAGRIARAARAGEPLSLVRLGDGEGNLLPYRAAYRPFHPTDIVATARVWWGTDAAPIDANLQQELRDAIDRADIVGMPDLLRVSHTVTPDALTAADSRGRNARGLLAALDYAATGKPQMLTSCHVHQSLAFWGLWDVLLPQFKTVSVVTCHEELGPALARRFGLTVAATHLVPPESKHAAKFASQIPGRHYPDRFDELRTMLAATPRGQIVLVAAGMLGKIYCDWIKAAGGIALDVGSAADIWCGYSTRAPDENASYSTPKGIRERLEALATHDPRMASVLGLTARGGDVLGD